MIAMRSRGNSARRRITYLVGLVLVLMIPFGLAWGKMPPFTVTVEPDPPVAGETTTISAEFESSFPVDELPGLMVLYPASGDKRHAQEIPITLNQVSSLRYEATVVIPEAGSWVLQAFPDRSDWPTGKPPPGYPDTIDLEVVASSESSATSGSAPAPLVPIGIVALLVAGLASLRLRRRRAALEGSVVEAR